MPKLVFDIETIGEDFDLLDETTQAVLTRWLKKESENEADYKIALEDFKNGLGFSPFTGQIAAIGVLDVDKNRGAVYYQNSGKQEEEIEVDGVKFKAMSEKEMLERFWEGAKNYDQFITFNGRSFDVPFLMVRSAVNGVRPSVFLMGYRYDKNSNHIDLMDKLSFQGAVRKKPNLHLVARAFGVKSPKESGITGEDVGRLFKEGKYLEIAKYNVGDLKAKGKFF